MEQNSPLCLPQQWKDKIEQDAQKQASMQFHSIHSRDQHTACAITYRQGAMAYAPWLYTCQTNYAALQAKCGRYEKALKDIAIRSDIHSGIYQIADKALSPGVRDEIRKQNIEAEITRRWNNMGYNHIGTRTRESFREEVEKLFNQKEDKQ